MTRCLVLLAVLMLAHLSACAETAVRNGSFEGGVSSDGVPEGWLSWSPSGKAVFRKVADKQFDGNSCAYIETPADESAVLVSEKHPVAPGESVTVTARVRTQDLYTSSGGTCALNIGFQDQYGQYVSRGPAKPLPANTDGWILASNSAIAPPKASNAVVHLGFRLMTGKSWWDSVTLETSSPVAIHFALPKSSMEPGETTVPLILINRDPALARNLAELTVKPGGKPINVRLPEPGATTVPVSVNIRSRNKVILEATLKASGATFTTSDTVTVPPQLVAEPILPVYYCQQDGPPHLEGRVWVHEPAPARAAMKLVCELNSSSGTLATWTSPVPLSANPVVYTMAPPPSTPRGNYAVHIMLQSLEGRHIAEISQDWHIISRADTLVTLDSNGFLKVDGKPFFPIGIFDGTDFPELGEAGVNVTQNYDVGHVRQGEEPDNNRMKKMLDSSVEAGMKHLFLVSHGPNCRDLNEGYLRRLRIFRDHPGVLCWYQEEGVARGDQPCSFLGRFYNTVKKIAPERPIVVGDAIDVITKVTDRSHFFPEDAMDVGIWWWYPIPISQSVRPDAYAGEEASKGAELAPPTFLTLAKTTKPIWVGLQCYKKPGGRFPTPAEYRAQAYIAIIHGAKGVLYYTGRGSSGEGVQNQPEEGHWAELKQLASELRDMTPTLTSPDARQQPVIETSGVLVSTRLKQTTEGLVLLAANRDNRPVDAAIRIPGVGKGTAEACRENRQIQYKEGLLQDRFEGYDVHVYKLGLQGKTP